FQRSVALGLHHQPLRFAVDQPGTYLLPVLIESRFAVLADLWPRVASTSQTTSSGSTSTSDTITSTPAFRSCRPGLISPRRHISRAIQPATPVPVLAFDPIDPWLCKASHLSKRQRFCADNIR